MSSAAFRLVYSDESGKETVGKEEREPPSEWSALRTAQSGHVTESRRDIFCRQTELPVANYHLPL